MKFGVFYEELGIMLSTELSGKYKIGETIVVNVDDGSVLVDTRSVHLCSQLLCSSWKNGCMRQPFLSMISRKH